MLPPPGVGFQIHASGHPSTVTPEDVGTGILLHLLDMTAHYLGYRRVSRGIVVVVVMVVGGGATISKGIPIWTIRRGFINLITSPPPPPTHSPFGLFARFVNWWVPTD